MSRRVNAIAVVQCAAAKSPSAGHFVSPNEGRVLFVAAPELAPSDNAIVYRRPTNALLAGSHIVRCSWITTATTERTIPSAC